MTTRLALILSGVWTLIVIAGCSGAIWFVTAKVPRHEQEKRGQLLGGTAATIALIGYAAIMLPWAVAFRRRREAERARQADEDDETPPPRPKRGRKKS